jgi:hypothetical protein
MILRNEPNSFSHISRYIIFIYRSLCRLQECLQIGFVFQNEPNLGRISLRGRVQMGKVHSGEGLIMCWILESIHAGRDACATKEL